MYGSSGLLLHLCRLWVQTLVCYQQPLNPNPTELVEGSYEAARAKAEDFSISEWRRLDSLTIIRLHEDLNVFEDIGEVALGG